MNRELKCAVAMFKRALAAVAHDVSRCNCRLRQRMLCLEVSSCVLSGRKHDVTRRAFACRFIFVVTSQWYHLLTRLCTRPHLVYRIPGNLKTYNTI